MSPNAEDHHDQSRDSCVGHSHHGGHHHNNVMRKGHHHPHGHSHGHHHDHHAVKNIQLAFLLNFTFAVIQFFGGIFTGSVAIMSGALHDFGDSLSLASAWFFENKSRQASNQRYSYGYRRYSLLSAVVTGVTLVVGSILVLVHAVPRLFDPQVVNAQGMVVLACLGVAVNGFMAWRTHRGHTLNEQVISWHLMEDVMSWGIVLVVGAVMAFVDLPILDPILSVVFSLFILRGVVLSLLSAIKLFLQASPEGVDIPALDIKMRQVPGVVGIHDLHLWSLDGDRHVLSVHVVLGKGHTLLEAEAIKEKVREAISSQGNMHATIEIESEETACPTLDCVGVGG